MTTAHLGRGDSGAMPSACVVTGYGPPEVLEWQDVPMPEPPAAQIRIRVRVSDAVDIGMQLLTT